MYHEYLWYRNFPVVTVSGPNQQKKSESLETSIDKDIVVVDNNTTENTNAENQTTIMNTSEAGDCRTNRYTGHNPSGL